MARSQQQAAGHANSPDNPGRVFLESTEMFVIHRAGDIRVAMRSNITRGAAERGDETRMTRDKFDPCNRALDKNVRPENAAPRAASLIFIGTPLAQSRPCAHFRNSRS
jgi:hypothetical protein